MELVKLDWYEELVEDVNAVITEGLFHHHWILIETYHMIGERITNEEKRFKEMGFSKGKVVKRVAEDVGRSERMIRYGIKLYETFPDLNMLPEGKNITMRKVIDKYLTDGDKSTTKSTVTMLNEMAKQKHKIKIENFGERWVCRIGDKTSKGDALIEAVRGVYNAIG